MIQGIDALSHKNPRYITSPSLIFKHSETGLDEYMFSVRGIIYYLIYMINGPKWPFFTILPLF